MLSKVRCLPMHMTPLVLPNSTLSSFTLLKRSVRYKTYNEQIQRRPVPHAAFVNEVRRDRAGNRWPATTRARLTGSAHHVARGGGSNWGAGILSVAVVYCRVLELS